MKKQLKIKNLNERKKINKILINVEKINFRP